MKVAVIITGLLLFGFVAVLVFTPNVISDFSEPPDRSIAVADKCLGVLPKKQRIGFKADLQSNSALIIDVGGTQESGGSENEEIVDRVLTCIEKAYETEEIPNTFVSKKPLPIGLIGQKWSNSEFSIHLERENVDNDNIVLNNLRFPAAAGRKEKLLRDWCDQFSGCVECRPPPSDDAFSEAGIVTISLRDDAPVEKKKMWGSWTNPKDPWELIDDSGTRYYFICKTE